MVIKLNEAVQIKSIEYEFPFRVHFVGNESDYDDVDFNDQYGWTGDVFKTAKVEFNEANLVQYIRDEELKFKILDIYMSDYDIKNNVSVCTVKVQVRDDFTQEDSKKLMNYLTGQLSDGWGEGFEQREIGHFSEDYEQEEYDEEEDEYYTETYQDTIRVYGEFYWSNLGEDSRGTKWYIRQV